MRNRQNTPGVIRWPFERFCRLIPRATLFRVNRGYKDGVGYRGYPQVPEDLGNRAYPMDLDAGEAVDWLLGEEK